MRSTFAVRETASLGIMGAPRVPPLNPSETIVLCEGFVIGPPGSKAQSEKWNAFELVQILENKKGYDHGVF